MDGQDFWDEIQSAWQKIQDKTLGNFQIAEDPANVMIWYFLVSGLAGPYIGGEFLGTLKFENTFPRTQPILSILTPNGRIQINTEIKCFTDSEWQQDPQPQRCVERIIQFMMAEEEEELPFLIPQDHHTVVALAESSKSSNLIHKNLLEYIHQQSATKNIVLNNPSALSNSKKNRIQFERTQAERAELLSALEAHAQETLKKNLHLDEVELPIIELLPDTSEFKKELAVIRVSVCFAKWQYLQQTYYSNLTSSDDSREATKKLVVFLLDDMMSFAAEKFQKRLVFSKLDFSGSDVSLRAVFNGTLLGIPIHRETEVEHLNLSATQTSENAMLNLFRLTNLQELYLDHCNSLIRAGKSVFSALAKHNPIPNLRLLSVVGTSSALSHKWLSEVSITCPKLSEIYFTRKRGTKALGWQDIIMMQTMRKPMLLPCGHIGDKASMGHLGYCSLDRTPFDTDSVILIEPAISYLCKSEDKWGAHIVDFLRAPLDAKTSYHPCGHFFNIPTLIKLYSIAADSSADDVITTVKEQVCVACSQSFENLRLCYPHSAEANAEELSFNELSDVGAYSISGLAKKKKK